MADFSRIICDLCNGVVMLRDWPNGVIVQVLSLVAVFLHFQLDKQIIYVHENTTTC